jgi:hypothetical protein
LLCFYKDIWSGGCIDPVFLTTALVGGGWSAGSELERLPKSGVYLDLYWSVYVVLERLHKSELERLPSLLPARSILKRIR